jgi:integrase/recombinase XerD
VLKAWWHWLVVTGRREKSPLDRLQKPRGPVYLPKPATREQIRRVPAGRLAPDTRAKILLGAYAGLRVSEMASFRGEYLDVAERRVRILGKGESDHVLPVHDQLLGVAARYPTAGPWRGGGRPHRAGRGAGR